MTLFRSKSRRKRFKQALFDFDVLEQRNLLASFSGTDGDDIVTIQFVDGTPSQIEINGELFDNPDPILDIDFGSGNDELRLQGAAFRIIADKPSGAEGDGTVNEVVDFVFVEDMTIVSDIFDDEIDVDGRISVFAKAGNDTITYGLGQVIISGGGGHDHFISENGDLPYKLHGDWGYDTWESRGERTLLEVSGLGFSDLDDDDMDGVERLIAVSPLDNPDVINSIRTPYISNSSGFRFDIHADRAVMSHPNFEDYFVALSNFNVLGGAHTFHGELNKMSVANVRSTAYPMSLPYFEKVILGGSFENGDTSKITHPINLSADKLMISNAASPDSHRIFTFFNGERHSAKVTITGLTEHPIVTNAYSYDFNLYPTGFDLVLKGSSTAANRFLVSGDMPGQNDYVPVTTRLHGGSANDVFLVGHSHHGGLADLDRFPGSVAIQGDGGYDFLEVDDRAAVGEFDYRLRDHWLYQARSSESRTFGGIWHDGLESVLLTSNDEANTIRVTPSFVTRYQIRAGSPTEPVGDRLILVGAPTEAYFRPTEDRNGIWVFGVDENGDRPLGIHFFDVETHVVE